MQDNPSSNQLHLAFVVTFITKLDLVATRSQACDLQFWHAANGRQVAFQLRKSFG